jgi:hypothetical protein
MVLRLHLLVNFSIMERSLTRLNFHRNLTNKIVITSVEGVNVALCAYNQPFTNILTLEI